VIHSIRKVQASTQGNGVSYYCSWCRHETIKIEWAFLFNLCNNNIKKHKIEMRGRERERERERERVLDIRK